jgi:hypothetical protein
MKSNINVLGIKRRYSTYISKVSYKYPMDPRAVESSNQNLFTCISSWVEALCGPLHRREPCQLLVAPSDLPYLPRRYNLICCQVRKLLRVDKSETCFSTYKYVFITLRHKCPSQHCCGFWCVFEMLIGNVYVRSILSDSSFKLRTSFTFAWKMFRCRAFCKLFLLMK